MILFSSPQDAREAAALFRASSERKAEGRAVSVGLLESPFKPAAWLTAAELGSLASAKEFETVGASEETVVVMTHLRMDKIREISRSDYLAIVEGGVRFGAFIDAVTKAGLYFPHEPDALMREATIAELIMDGTIFRTEGRFGGLREYILALEIVTPAGEIITTGSRAVKDVTGYDIPSLVLGSGGLCGMIASATLRLLVAPGTRVPFACSGTAAALRGGAAAAHRELGLAFMEMFGERGAELLRGRMAAVEGARGEQTPVAGAARGAGAAGGAAGHGGSGSRLLLIGEVQTPERGRENEVLEKLRRHFADAGEVRALSPELVAEHRRYPLLALDSLTSGDSLLHLAYDDEAGGGAPVTGLDSCSFYPARLDAYIPYGIHDEVEPNGSPLLFACSKKYDEYLIAVLAKSIEAGHEAGSRPLAEAISARGVMEVIGRHNDLLCRRRIPLDELSLPAGEGPRASGAHGKIKSRQDILNDLAGRIYREFDPQGIMIR